MNSIDARIAAIAEAIKQRAMEQEAPVDDLSKSLFEFGRELAGLDEQRRDALFLKQDILTREQFDKFVLDYTNFN